MVERQGGAEDITSTVPFIGGTELAELQAGQLYEATRTFHSNPGETLVQKRARLDIIFGDVVTEERGVFEKRLGYWGYSRDVP